MKRYRLKPRARLGIIAVAAVLVFGVGGASLLALTGFFGGSGSESADLTRGLVGHWKLEEGTGQTAADSSGNSNNGTLGATSSAASDDPKWTPGPVETTNGTGGGSALQFDGVDDYVDAGSDSSLDFGSGDFTVSLWFKSDSTEGSQYIIATQENTSPYEGWLLGHYSADEIRFAFKDNDGTSQNINFSFTDTGNWHHVVALRDSSDFKLYLDGVLEASDTFVNMGNIPLKDILAIGARPDTLTGYFDGSIDDPRIYNRALSADEIRRLYNSRGPVAHYTMDEGSGRYARDSSRKSEDITTDLEAYWSMNDANVDTEGETITDVSGNSNTGTLYGDNGTGDNGTGMTCTATGKSDQGCDFDGVDDYVSIGSNAFGAMSGNFTISSWVKRGSTGTGDTILSEYDGGVCGDSIFQINSSDKVRFDDGTGNANTSDVTITDTNWHHVVYVYSGSRSQLYVDNSAQSDTNAASWRNNCNLDVRIGANSDLGTPFDGTIDETYIFSRALNADEVKYLYNLGRNDGTLGDATCQPGSGTCPSWMTGKYGGALSFDGTDDVVGIPSSSLGDSADGASEVTLSAWIKPSSYPANSSRERVISGLVGDNSTGVSLSLFDDAGNVEVGGRSGTGDSFQTATVSFPALNEWHHIVGILDYANDELLIYIDGELKQTSSATFSNTSYTQGSPPADDLDSIGATIPNGSPQDFFDGQIDDIKIYNYARTADQIRLDYNAGLAAHFGGTPDLSRGLVGHWPLDESSGQEALDASGNGNTGTLTNMDTSNDWVQGPTTQGLSGGAGALDFDGDDDYVSVDDNTNLQLTNWTISAWVNTETPSTRQGFVNKGSHNGPVYRNYAFEVNNSQLEAIFEDSAGTDQGYVTGGTITADTWHHAVWTYDQSNSVLYLDGVQVGSVAETATPDQGTPALHIGRYNPADLPFNGLIDDPRVYNRALSAEEIRYLYNNNGPVGHWKLDEGSGSTAYDDSNNNNDGTLTDADGANADGNTPPSWVSGKYGGALDFDGTDDYVDCGTDDTLNLPASYSFVAWIKTLTTQEGNIVSKSNSSVYTSYQFRVKNGNLSHYFYDGSSRNYDSNVTVADNLWHHVAIIKDGSSIIFYKDGISGQTMASVANSPSSSDDDCNIGRYKLTGGASYFDGFIDDVKIYPYARTAEQVREDYNAGLSAKFGGTPDLQRGLVGHWMLDEMTGQSAADGSGNGNAGTLGSSSSSDVNDPKWAQGVMRSSSYKGLSGGGTALSFDGVDDYVLVSDNSTLRNTSVSVSFWMYAHSFSGAEQDLVTKWTGSWGIWKPNGATNLVMWLKSGGTSYGGLSTGNLNNDQWYHIVYTYDGATMNAYVDGIARTPQSINQVMDTNASDIAIGNYTNGAYPFDGSIDDVRIYNRALSAEEIRYLYNNNGPVGHWAFDENSGTTAYDSASSNDGTLEASMTDSDWVPGKFGNALDFDGVDDSISGLGDQGAAAVTISGWFKADNVTSGRLVNLFQNTSDGWGALLSSGNLSIYDDIDNANNTYYAAPVSAGIWYHFAAVMESDTTNLLYIDGTLVGNDQSSSDGTDSFTASAYIGERGNSTVFFDGLIDDVKIYNYARAAEQIREDYNAGKSLYFR